MSSDPADLGAPNPYSTISSFLQTLHEKQPMRDLTSFAERFTFADYYHIDEIADMSKEELTDKYEIGMTSGNATFLLKAIKDEMKRVDKANGKRKRV